MSTLNSIRAYQEIEDKLPEKQANVLRVLRIHKEAILWDLGQSLGVPMSNVSPRISELERKGLVMNTGKKRINFESGKFQTVYAPARPGLQSVPGKRSAKSAIRDKVLERSKLVIEEWRKIPVSVKFADFELSLVRLAESVGHLERLSE